MGELKHVPVTSSAIASVAYDHQGTLEVKLTNGRSYIYGGVPPEVYADFMGADSPGRFYNQNIKSRYASKDSSIPLVSNDDTGEPV